MASSAKALMPMALQLSLGGSARALHPTAIQWRAHARKPVPVRFSNNRVHRTDVEPDLELSVKPFSSFAPRPRRTASYLPESAF